MDNSVAHTAQLIIDGRGKKLHKEFMKFAPLQVSWRGLERPGEFDRKKSFSIPGFTDII
jgi:hypothetical protein